MLSISHRRVKNRYLVLLFLEIFVPSIVGSLSNNLDMVKLHVDNQESKHSDAYSLENIELKVISDCYEEEYRSVWSCALVEIADDGDKCDYDPKVLLMIGLHDDHAFEVEQEQHYLLKRENVLSH